jgi:hypothetical protein
LAYIPEKVMICDDDYINKPERYKCLGKNDIHREDGKRINLTAIIKIYSIN